MVKKVYILVLLSVLTAFMACNPNKADLPSPTGVGDIQFLNLIATPTTPNNQINLYINGTRQNFYQIGYGLNSSYLSTASGSQSVSFKDSLLNFVFTPAVAVTIPTDSLTFYVTTNSVSGLIYSRDNTRPDLVNNNPQVRFVHASPDAPAYDLVLNTVATTATSSVTIANSAYKSVSTFVRPVAGTVTVNLNLAGTNTTVATRTYTLVSNKVYTIYVYGSVKGNNGTGINLGVITNY